MTHSEQYIKNLEKENASLKQEVNQINLQFFRSMLQSHKAVMLLIEPVSGAIIDANDAAVEFYKYPREELLNLEIQNINVLSPEEVKQEKEKVLNKKQSHFIFQHRLADNQKRWVEVYSSSFKSNDKMLLFSIIHDITERKKAEEEVRRNEEKFASVFRSNPNSLVLSNLEDGVILDINKSFLELTRLTRDEVIGKSTLDLDLYVSPDDRDKMIQILKEKGTVKNLEMNVRNHAGKELNVLVSSELLKTSSGQTILTTFQDITERVELNNKLKSEHALLQAIFDTVPAMISIYDPELNKVSLNSEFEKITGWTQQDWEQKDIMELVYPDPDYRKEVAEYMRTLQPGFKELIMTGKNQAAIETLWANVSLNDDRLIGIGIDIRERKEIQEELLKSRNQLEAALSSTTDAVFISDTEGNLISFNDAFAEFHRFANKEECSATFSEYPDILDVFLPDGHPAPVEQWAIPRALRGEVVTNTEYTIRRKDTGETWVGSFSFAPIRNSENNITGAVIVARDITEQKYAEAERDMLITQLAREKQALADFRTAIPING